MCCPSYEGHTLISSKNQDSIKMMINVERMGFRFAIVLNSQVIRENPRVDALRFGRGGGGKSDDAQAKPQPMLMYIYAGQSPNNLRA